MRINFLFSLQILWLNIKTQIPFISQDFNYTQESLVYGEFTLNCNDTSLCVQGVNFTIPQAQIPSIYVWIKQFVQKGKDDKDQVKFFPSISNNNIYGFTVSCTTTATTTKNQTILLAYIGIMNGNNQRFIISTLITTNIMTNPIIQSYSDYSTTNSKTWAYVAGFNTFCGFGFKYSSLGDSLCHTGNQTTSTLFTIIQINTTFSTTSPYTQEYKLNAIYVFPFLNNKTQLIPQLNDIKNALVGWQFYTNGKDCRIGDGKGYAFSIQLNLNPAKTQISSNISTGILDPIKTDQYQYETEILYYSVCPQYSTFMNESCYCLSGYYNSLNTQCIQCTFPCLTCSNVGINSCLSCNTTQNYYLNSGTCSLPQIVLVSTTDGTCPSGYYKQNQQCDLCYQTCLTCTGLSQCQSCIVTFTLNNTSCVCQSPLYFNSTLLACLNCDQTCSLCNGSDANSCTTCQSNQFRQLNKTQCSCQSNYYYDGQNSTCQGCLNFCQVCQNNSSCQVCTSNLTRELQMNNSICGCINGYYDMGQNCSSINKNYEIECSYSCITCSGGSSDACTNCSIKNLRTLGALSSSNQSTCSCGLGYFDDGKNPSCLKCNPTCLSCNGPSSSSCQSCDPCQNRILNQTSCSCLIGFTETFGQCQVATSSQQRKPQCDTQECLLKQINSCSGCQPGFYNQSEQLFNNTNISKSQECQPCDFRCLQCNGPSVSQCTICKFISIENQCKLCSDVEGLQTIGGICVSVCGDGIIYKPREECDDTNFNEYDGCSLCMIVPVLGKSLLTFTNNSQPFNNTRIAIVTFSQNYTLNDFLQWRFVIPNYDPTQYNLTFVFMQNQLQINITFNQSVQGKYLNVIATGYSPLVQQKMSAVIPDYTFVGQNVVQLTQNAVSASSIFIDLIVLIMLISLLTGGFNMLFELLDLLQLLSYLKYLNVDYPYNVNAFFNYLGAFNYSYITNYFPYVNSQSVTTYLSNSQQAATQPPDKINQDGYITLFTYNFMGIVQGWLVALITYLGAKFVSKIFSRWNNIDNLDSLKGICRSLYMLRFTISRSIVIILSELSQNFFYSGLLTTFIASEYALNFSLMMEFNQLHLTSSDIILNSSSWLAFLILFLKFKLTFYIFNQIEIKKRVQMQQIRFQNEIGSVVEGLKLTHVGAKFFGILDTLKIFLFMFFLVILYDNPIYQVGGVIFISLITSVFYVVFRPHEDENDYQKSILCEISFFAATCLILLIAVNSEIKFLTDDQKILFGWCIIGCCLVMILVQIIIDVKVHVRLICKQLVQLCRFIRIKMAISRNRNKQKIQQRKLPASTKKFLISGK